MERLAEVAELIVKGHEEHVKFDAKTASAELAHLLTTPGYTTDKSALKDRGLQEFKMEQETKAKEDALEALLKDELEAIVTALQATEETFMLASPESLTVKRPNGTYSKKAHIGSEDFKPQGVYLGKRGKLIFVFKPVMVADYTEMEMDETQAKEKLMGFKDWCKDNLAQVQAKIAETRAESAVAHERAEMAKRADQYQHLGFGEW